MRRNSTIVTNSLFTSKPPLICCTKLTQDDLFAICCQVQCLALIVSCWCRVSADGIFFHHQLLLFHISLTSHGFLLLSSLLSLSLMPWRNSYIVVHPLFPFLSWLLKGLRWNGRWVNSASKLATELDLSQWNAQQVLTFLKQQSTKLHSNKSSGD